ncbi:1,4-dihydroxy-2-naphthoate polyprenyltransferase [Paenibacillus senegalimassiliensis]|uniref:1,4-dihydroxy-2-naphthoate polyprenyltransferase n=1 Tax=Paenibacillus senegalimassiliensis TaxID=1737426 RepID=UPI00073F09C9|nr:1,4-dihydroxy-2-naphthoate polyprenyltransferase [Paenibacillus senegalimassiliensis]
MITKFLRLVEIQTKAASLIPLLMGTLYAVYRFHIFQPGHFALMLLSLLTFDMTTTAINNYYDYKKAARKHGYGYETHNPIVKYGMNPRAVLALIILMFLIAVAAGIMLFLQTGWLLLLLGGLSFAVGILYSFGPIPISRMPLGEIFSGLFMGFVIIFVSAYVHAGDKLASLTLEGGAVTLQIQLLEVLLIFLISIPAIFGIANIMLANNICDMEEDIENKRYTLPIYIGKPAALLLFKLLYYAGYADLIILVFLGVHPLILVMVLATLIPVHRNIRQFSQQPTKQFTFRLAVKNFILTNMARIVALGLAIIFSL